jgi:ribosomal protein L16 Arg81 hydroxylase
MKNDFLSFPLAATARHTDVVLCPGDMLYIPRHCWHWIASLDVETARELSLHQSQASIITSQTLDILEEARTSAADRNDNNHKQEILSPEYRPLSGERGKQQCSSSSHSWSVNFWWGKRILKLST